MEDDIKPVKDADCKAEEKPEEYPLPPFPDIIIPRAGWGAAPPARGEAPLTHPVPNVVFTYNTGVEKCEEEEACVKAVQEIQRRHTQQEGMADIAFNFLIGGDFRVYEGRGWQVQPDPNHQFPELQGCRLDVGFIGDYNNKIEKDQLPWAMAGIGIDLCHYGVTQGHLLKRYRLLETQQFLSVDDYVPGEEEEFPELEFRIEDYYPGNVIRQDNERDLMEDSDQPDDEDGPGSDSDDDQ